MANILRVELDSDCQWPIKDVTVYEDRAQVVRILDYKASDSGEVELKLINLPTTLYENSVRAEVLSNNAGIIEVSSEVVRGKPAEIGTSERSIEITEEIKLIDTESEVLRSRADLLSSYYKNMVPSRGKIMNKNTLFDDVVNEDNLNAFAEGLDKFADEINLINEKETKLTKKKSILNKEMNKIVDDMMVLSNASLKSTTIADILLNVPEKVSENSEIISIKLIYNVYGCSWRPSYDIRVIKQDNSVELAYYGQVINGSGEDWNETQLYLSTAKPSRAGDLPSLPKQAVKFMEHRPKMKTRNLLQTSRMFQRDEMMESVCDMDFSYMAEEEAELEESPELTANLKELAQADTSEAQERGGSATFKLTRLCTIKNDGKPHKQNISTVPLEPTFSYVLSPQVSESCFLRCTTRNESKFVFVPGPMSVFFNGSYVTTTDMSLVNKRQEFSVYLGQEDSIKMTITPQSAKKQNKKKNLLASRLNKEMFSRIIRIENTRNEEVDIIVYEQVPLTRDNKIKVEIISPKLTEKITKNMKETYKLNVMNHVEAKKRVKSGKTWELTFSYSVEWPDKTNIIYTESLENIDV